MKRDYAEALGEIARLRRVLAEIKWKPYDMDAKNSALPRLTGKQLRETQLLRETVGEMQWLALEGLLDSSLSDKAQEAVERLRKEKDKALDLEL